MLGGELKNDLEKLQKKRKKRQIQKIREQGQSLEKVDKVIGSFGGGLILVMVSITLVYWFQN